MDWLKVINVIVDKIEMKKLFLIIILLVSRACCKYILDVIVNNVVSEPLKSEEIYIKTYNKLC